MPPKSRKRSTSAKGAARSQQPRKKKAEEVPVNAHSRKGTKAGGVSLKKKPITSSSSSLQSDDQSTRRNDGGERNAAAAAAGWPRWTLRLLLRKRVLVTLLLIAYFVMSESDRVVQRIPPGMLVEDPARPGLSFESNHGVRHRRPVWMLPGFITTGLELWKWRKCVSSNVTRVFRQRLFGSHMLMTLLRDPQCFLDHMGLDEADASDPPGIKMRPSGHLESADYFVPGFWVWAKIILNLADIGFDMTNLLVTPYDWRLSPALMQKRDRFFSRTKSAVESLVAENNGMAVVAVSHSYASVVFVEFVKWVEAEDRGWCDRHVHSFFNIGGITLGLPKATAAVVTGEVRDTAMMPSVTKLMLDSHIDTALRARVFRSWPCLGVMQPRGCGAVYPTLLSTHAQTVELFHAHRHRHGLHRRGNRKKQKQKKNVPPSDAQGGEEEVVVLEDKLVRTMATEDAIEFAEDVARRGRGVNSSASLLADYIRDEHDLNDVRQFPASVTKLHSFCVYGVGIPAEVGYHIVRRPSDVAADEEARKHGGENSNDDGWNSTAAGNKNSAFGPFVIDTEVEGKGVVTDNGDGTVPLVSLGYLCRSRKNGWEQPGIGRKVTTLEIPHEPPPTMDPRGGIATADHVDIMGNYEMITTLLLLATGNEAAISGRVVSDIDARVRRVDEECPDLR